MLTVQVNNWGTAVNCITLSQQCVNHRAAKLKVKAKVLSVTNNHWISQNTTELQAWILERELTLTQIYKMKYIFVTLLWNKINLKKEVRTTWKKPPKNLHFTQEELSVRQTQSFNSTAHKPVYLLQASLFITKSISPQHAFRVCQLRQRWNYSNKVQN